VPTAMPPSKPGRPARSDEPGPGRERDEGTAAGTPRDAPKTWHESSRDLETGLDAFESEWPDDTTMPGAFDPLGPDHKNTE
jgi:hypothetical protein